VATTSFTVGLPFTLTTVTGSASGESVSPAIAISLQDLLSQPTKVFVVLPFQG
jgi:hypothetical protein